MTGGFSFEVVDATHYDDLRPGYAGEAVGWVRERGALKPRSRVVDLAAGTGQLSKVLASFEVNVVAVEPAANMRGILHARLPDIRVVGGVAEALPLRDGCVDAAVVGNAFHHFDRSTSFAELRRVLTPGGVLALFWAWPLEEQQRAIEGMDEVYETVQRARTDSRIMAAYRSWEEPPAQADGFGSFERREFPLTHVLPAARLADLYATSSDVASMPSIERARLLAEIASLSRSLPETLQLPSRTVVDLCHRSTDGEGTDRSG